MKYTFLFSTLLLASVQSFAQDSASAKKFDWNGDIRLRINRSKDDTKDERFKEQLRARVGAKAAVNETADAYIRLSTGTTKANSPNQDMGDQSNTGMPRRSIGLDWAYVDWHAAESTQVWVGRSANPYWSPGKVQTILDSDVSFEGMAVKWKQKWDSSSLFLNLGATMLYESYDSTNGIEGTDIGLMGAQLGYTYQFESSQATLHVGSYQYTGIQNKPLANLGTTSSTTNTNSGSGGVFTEKYNLMDAGLEWKMKFDAGELMVFGEYVKNTGVSEKNQAYEAGLGFKSGNLGVSAAWIEKKADSVLAIFTDSDTNGGETDNRGSRISLSYDLAKNANVIVTQFDAKRKIETTATNYSMTFADFNFSF